MTRGKKHTVEQIVSLLRQIEVAVENGKTTAQASKEALVTEQAYFGSPESARAGILEGAIETEQRAWWIDSLARTTSQVDRYYMFKIWETAMVWFVRIGPSLDQFFPELLPGNVVVDLALSQIIGKLDLRPAAFESIVPVSRFPVNVSDGCMKVTVPMAFVGMGRHARNIAERALVETFVYGTAILSGVEDPDERTASLVEALDIQDGQRFMHMFEANDARDYLREYDAAKLELLKDADVYFAPAGVALECPAAFVPELMRQTGMRGA
jgi:hypothetical protein